MIAEGNKKRHILIVGSGSIGKRHAENFKSLGCELSCCDPRQDRLNEISDAVGGKVAVFSILDEALATEKYDGVVIGSPTRFHPEQGISALEKGIPVLMEKPVAISLKEAQALSRVANETDVPVLLGYTWRWWEPLRKVRTILRENRIGRLFHVQFHMSAHLADWHPWEAYQDFFMSKKDLGGGALLDESHWIDLMIWFFGMPSSLYGCVEKISSLEIETDDNVDFLAYYKDGKRVYVHLDLFARPHERFIRFVGEKGTIFWSSEPNEIRIDSGQNSDTEIETFSCERNDMFMGVANEFISILDGEKNQTCTLDDGLNAMKVIEVIRKSSVTGSRVICDDKK